MWEVDWTHEGNTGQYVWARNPKSHIRASREWHFTSTGNLREVGIKTPKYRADSWEVDWSKRDGKKVWARNPSSKMPDSREWHWIDHRTLDRSGVEWKPFGITGKHIDSRGYVVLTRRAMTDDDIRLANEHGIWKIANKKRSVVLEHRLVALKKYGCLPPDTVVRHINGDKQDNRPENLILGTTQENTMDHNTARIAAMVWREKYETAMRELQALRDDPGSVMQDVREALTWKP